ncbi:phosphatase PAP2 family protein [Rhodopirellula sp. JC740]|uniref:Phosphatase PAP2 family protein n=1 Tax=Rhodopirellula halodulae TaxID=2894198 RepID=A0ABS8NLZ3_9BACT|nr:phosphatase PAP2 family protein [Rhodopirellula sp. JC740]
MNGFEATSPRESNSLGKTNATNDAVTLYRPVTLFYMGAMTMMLVPMLTLLDVTVARYFETRPLPAELDSALELSLVLSHGYGVFVILLAILLMAPKRRWHLPRLATLAMGGGAIATIAKMFVIRPRPSNLNLDLAGHDTAWLWAFDWDLSEVASFDSAMRAFPSGHVVTATAMLIGLWVVVPRGRLLFAMVWAGVLINRVNTSAHFLSDVCGGVAFGLFWSYVCFHPRLLGNLFDKMVPEHGRQRLGRQTETSETINVHPEPAFAIGGNQASFPMTAEVQATEQAEEKSHRVVPTHSAPQHVTGPQHLSATEQYEQVTSQLEASKQPSVRSDDQPDQGFSGGNQANERAA